MSVANVTMFEFQNPESVEEFASWYKGHGTYPNNDISLFVRTGETSAIGISVYPLMPEVWSKRRRTGTL